MWSPTNCKITFLGEESLSGLVSLLWLLYLYFSHQEFHLRPWCAFNASNKIKNKKSTYIPSGMFDTRPRMPRSVGVQHVSNTDTANNLKCLCLIGGNNTTLRRQTHFIILNINTLIRTVLRSRICELKENVRDFRSQIQDLFLLPFLFPQQIPSQILDPNIAWNVQVVIVVGKMHLFVKVLNKVMASQGRKTEWFCFKCGVGREKDKHRIGWFRGCC